MNVELQSDDFRKLVELAYLGEWMINAQHDADYQDETAGRVLQKLLSASELKDVGRDDETGEYFMTAEWLERLYDAYILDYDDHVFWDELTERLAQRDLARQRGVGLEEINRDDDLLELRPSEEHYRNELEEHGVERLEIISDY